jgi:hypothetical protein
MHSSFVRDDGTSGAEGRETVTRAEQFDMVRRAIEADPNPNHRLAHAATLSLLDRSDRADTGNFTDGWDRFAERAAALVDEDRWAVTVGVMANMVGLVHFAEAADFVTASRLAKRYGHRKVAAVQTTVDAQLGTGRAMPVATRAVMILGLTDWIAELLEESGLDRETATEIAERCYQIGFWLVMTDVDPSRPGPPLTTTEEVARTWDVGGLPAWRGQVAIIASNPWAPYAGQLKELALAADRPTPVHAIDEAVKIYRARFERRERELVAREIRRLVAVSGLSQREFAAMSGTSASRLSTYVNGLVTPSATMMVRIRRVSEFVQRRGSNGNG